MRRLALSLLAVLLVPAEALSADLAPPREILFEETPIASQRGFYARVDAILDIPIAPDASRFRNESLAIGGGMEGGLGYQFNEWFRADATVGFVAPRGYDARGVCLTCGNGTISSYDANITTVPILANAYVGLPNSTIFTPYVGGGIGAAYVSVGDFTETLANNTVVNRPDHSQWNFAWQLSAGVSADILPNASVDLGYRYLNAGEARGGRVAGQSIDLGDVQSHQIRLGVRMSLFQ